MTDKIKKRRLRNYFLRDKGQSAYGLTFAAVTGSMLLGMMLAYVGAFIAAHSTICSGMVDQTCAEQGFISFDFNASEIVAPIGIGLISILVSFAIGIVYSHRTFGPLVAIERHIVELIKGNYGARVTLRSGDHLQSMSQKLNRLAEKLEAKDAAERPTNAPTSIAPDEKPQKIRKHVA